MACTISTVLADAACFSNGAITPRQQKLYLAYMYFLWASVVGADVPSGPLEWTEYAKCWQVLTDDQVRASEIISVQAGISATTPTDLSPADLQPELKCIAGLSDHELDRIIAAFKCTLFQELGVPA